MLPFFIENKIDMDKFWNYTIDCIIKSLNHYIKENNDSFKNLNIKKVIIQIYYHTIYNTKPNLIII